MPAGTEHGHPHKPVMERLMKMVAKEFILRTDDGEDESVTDEEPRFDDNLIFNVSLEKITSIHRIKY